MEPEAIAVLEEAPIHQSLPQLVEAFFVSTVTRYVELGFGIALIPVIRGRPQSSTLHERVMSDHFGRAIIYQLRRKGLFVSKSAAAFTGIVQARLGR